MFFGLAHRGDVSSLLYANPPPKIEVGRRPLGGGGGSLGGRLAADGGFSGGMASR